MKAMQITVDDWLKAEKANPLQLAELPFTVAQIEAGTGFAFVEYLEEGHGRFFSCFLHLDGQDAHLLGFMERDGNKIGVVVEMHSTEKQPQILLHKVCALLGITLNELRWVSAHAGAPNHIVYRVDDNGNEIEMERFHVEAMAKRYADKYQAKGHKQIYLIKKAI